MTTPVFTCGFECGDVGGISTHWSAGAGIPVLSTTTVRSGARSLRCNPVASTIGVTSQSVHTSSTRHIGRFYIQFATLPSADTALANFGSVSGTGPNVRFKQSDSKIYAAVGSTLGATGVSVTTGVWYRIDYDFNVNTTGADFCDVQVDGSACGQATGTGTSSSSALDAFGILAACTADAFFDDILLSSTAADYPLGGGFVNHFVPTSDGTHNIAGTGDFQRGNSGTDILNTTTTAFQLIDDVPLPSGTVDEADCIRAVAPPNATDYTECVFGPASGISVPTTAPRAVEVVLAYHQVAAQTGQMVVELNDNGTINTVFDTGSAAGVTTYRYARKHYATGPAGAWVIGGGGNGDFTDLRVRFRAPDAAPDQCLDAIMIEAEFLTASTPLTQTAADDVNNLADALTKQLNVVLTVALSDSANNLSDALTGMGYGLLTTESVNNLNDTLTLGHGLNFTDATTTLTDALVKTESYQLSFSDSVNNLADTQAQQLGVSETLADTLATLADAQTQLLIYLLALTDSQAANWADAHQLLLAQFLALTDTLATLSETTVVVLDQRESFTDTLSLLDAAVVVLSYEEGFADSVPTLTDNYSQQLTQLVTFSDSFALTDSVALGYGLLVTDDSFNLADAYAQQRHDVTNALELDLGDALSLSDSLALGHGLLTGDSFSLTDSVEVVLGQLVELADTTTLLSDSTALQLAHLIAFDDSFLLVDNESHTLGYDELLTDSIDNLTDSNALELGQLLTFADTLSLTDSLALGIGLAISDTAATLSDSAQLELRQLLDFNDTLILTDSQSSTLGYGVSFTDSIDNLTDTETTQLNHLLSFNESIDNFADTYLQTLGASLNFSDSLTLADSLSLGYGLLITEDANLLMDDVITSAPQGPLRQVGVTDALTTLSDELALQLDYLLAVSDTAATLNDSISLLEGLRTEFSDSLSFTDSLAATLDHLQSLADSFLLSDAIQLRVGDEVAVSDALLLSDSISLRLGYELAVTDTISLTDSIALVEGYLLAASDSLTLTDSTSAQLGQLVQLSDSFTLADSVQLRLGYELALADVVTLTDNATQSPGYLLTLSDNVALLADSTSISLGLTAIISDNLQSFTESISFASAGFLRLSDTITLLDSFTTFGEYFVTFSDSFLLTDDLDFDLRGPDLDESLSDSLQLDDAIAITLGDELQYSLVFTETLTLSDHYFDLRLPYTPSAKRHIVVPSRARVTRPVGRAKVIVPGSDRTTKVN